MGAEAAPSASVGFVRLCLHNVQASRSCLLGAPRGSLGLLSPGDSSQVPKCSPSHGALQIHRYSCGSGAGGTWWGGPYCTVWARPALLGRDEPSRRGLPGRAVETSGLRESRPHLVITEVLASLSLSKVISPTASLQGSLRSRCQQGCFLLRPLSWVCGRPSSPRVLTWSSLCMCLCPHLLLLSGHSRIGLGPPHDLILP